MIARRGGSTAPPKLGATIERIDATVYEVPTDTRESDGTLAWDKTTVVVVHAFGGGMQGIGWTFAHGSASEIATGPLAKVICGLDVAWTSAAYSKMSGSIRNIGRPGLGWEALSAVDVALWDLRAKLLGVPLFHLLGPAREAVRAYGSGGFTSYDDRTLAAQLGGWSDDGFTAVKMKVGREPGVDLHRVEVAREAIGRDVALMVDANGAWDRKQALAQMELFSRYGVSWVEEPVTSEDIEGLRLARDRAPAGVEVSTGEYGYVPDDFRRLLVADCVDVLQADGTRCGGITGLLAVDAMCEAFHMPLSTHCAPLLHSHPACAMRTVRHVEYFHDHARIERLLFRGVVPPRRGSIAPDPRAPGLGVSIGKEADRFRR